MITTQKPQKKWKNKFVIVVNVVLMVGLVLLFLGYDNDYKQKLYDQNVDDISNINQASSNIASTFFSGREAKLRDVALYVEQWGLTLAESMNYIECTNSDDAKTFEILGEDGKGFCIQKTSGASYIPVDYSSAYPNIKRIVQANQLEADCKEINFAAEFTDYNTAMKSFALYNYLEIKGDSGERIPYTLMLVSQTSDFIDLINIETDYEEISTAIINAKGEYIIGNSEFKSNNFYQYLATFNDWTLDWQKELREEVLRTGKGTLKCLDYRGKDCVFVYTQVPEKDWYCLTVVPVERFHNRTFDLSFTIIAIIVLLVLLAIDFTYLYTLNRRMRISVENEKAASAAKMDFLSRMSHDMRTPMNGIIGMTRLTQDIPGLSKEAQENLASIEDSSNYLLNLINDTLDMNKIESKRFSLNPEIVNVKTMMAHILSTITPLVNAKQIQLDLVSVNAQPEYILADRIRLQQIFLNVLSNAVKFTPDGGKIRIVAENLNQESDKVTERVSVEDSGCGMSEEFLNHIFEPFVQEQTRIVKGQEGTGLGMSIVKSLVEMMDGQIRITSKQGVGTKVEVEVSFPLPDKIPEEQRQADCQSDVSLQGRRILLAEDHPLNAVIAERLLAKKKILVEHAENGKIALEMFQKSSPHYYDLILMDIRMPEMNGLETASLIRQLERSDAKTIPIIAMTANAYAEDIQAALAAGMNTHLAKPVVPEILYETITAQIRSEKV